MNNRRLGIGEDGGNWSMDNTRKPQWLFGVLLISLIIDVANVFRLVHGQVPCPFLIPWVVAGLVTLYLTFSRQNSKVLRIVLWIVLSLAVLLLSILSDGTNLSLWVWMALLIGPVTTVPARQMQPDFSEWPTSPRKSFSCHCPRIMPSYPMGLFP